MASPAQIAANRRNAQKSTGPRTPRGKVWSRRNSWKHGCYATSGTIHPDDLSARETFLSKYRTAYQPATPAMEQAVDQLAVAEWQSHLARFAEVQLIENLMPANESTCNATRIAYERALSEGPLLTIHRFHARSQRNYIRALKAMEIAERSQFSECLQQTTTASSQTEADDLPTPVANHKIAKRSQFRHCFQRIGSRLRPRPAGPSRPKTGPALRRTPAMTSHRHPLARAAPSMSPI